MVGCVARRGIGRGPRKDAACVASSDYIATAWPGRLGWGNAIATEWNRSIFRPVQRPFSRVGRSLKRNHL